MFNQIRSLIRKIPKGKVSTYGEVAKAAGYAGAARQVAWALHSSSGMGLPWHRVLGLGGKILLSGEHGMEQRLRLETEGVVFRGLRVDMKQHEFKFVRRTKKGRQAKRKN
jgi:methylated-DNA-protein-cysteine methyltransferase related protein